MSRSASEYEMEIDQHQADFLKAVIQGMRRQPKTIPCKYLYDARGCELFEEICLLDEYYLTRAELEIMKRYAAEMARFIGPNVQLVELGAGSGLKTQLLLEHLEHPHSYVPVDIAPEYLDGLEESIGDQFPDLNVQPLLADFSKRFDLPSSPHDISTTIYFPGSTIGNLSSHEARQLLERLYESIDGDGQLLIGVDLKKDEETLHAAYNDSQGVTAEFNKNLLNRINRELDGDFDLNEFEHRAQYNEAAGRIEMKLISHRDQHVRIGGHQFKLNRGESICTEHCHKYDQDEFAELAELAGWHGHHLWTDSQEEFSVQFLSSD